jgi:hypothetical protein
LNVGRCAASRFGDRHQNEKAHRVVFDGSFQFVEASKGGITCHAGVEPCAIIEYRWKRTEDGNRFPYVRLHFQREFPAQNVTYFVRPLSSALVVSETIYLVPLNCRPTPIKEGTDGYSSTTLENVPGAHEEPLAPSKPNLEPCCSCTVKTEAGTPTSTGTEKGRAGMGSSRTRSTPTMN